MLVSSVPASPKRWICVKCRVVRSKNKGGLCPVCWLVDELAREHRDGEHVDRENRSCIDCTRQHDNAPPIPRMSHKDCTHPKTLAARQECRRERRRRQVL